MIEYISLQGDSGGPQVIKNPNKEGQFIQIGVVSWGKGCGGNSLKIIFYKSFCFFLIYFLFFIP